MKHQKALWIHVLHNCTIHVHHAIVIYSHILFVAPDLWRFTQWITCFIRMDVKRFGRTDRDRSLERRGWRTIGVRKNMLTQTWQPSTSLCWTCFEDCGLWFPLVVSVYVCKCVYDVRVCVRVCLCLCVYMSVCLSLALSIGIYVCVCVSVRIWAPPLVFFFSVRTLGLYSSVNVHVCG